jgi:pleiotropic regulator 1
LPQESNSTALVANKKVELNLAETTKLGTIKASSIRKLIKPTWHRPFKLYRVVAAHQGWVRCLSISPDNTFFCTGSNDRTIKFWDLASGKLKITLTGHINAVRGVELSRLHPYLFSCAEDKTVKCWDL